MSQQINLYNPALAPKVDLYSGRAVTIGVAAVLALSLLAWAAAAWQDHSISAEEQRQSARLAGLQAEVARMTQAVAARKPDPALQQELADVEALLAARGQVMGMLGAGVLGDTKGVSEYFQAFGRQREAGVWLTGFTIAGKDLAIEGRTLDAQLLPGYLEGLRRESVLRGRGFESLAVSQPPPARQDGKEVEPGYLEFRMATAVKPAAGQGAAR